MIDILAFSPHPDDAEIGCGGTLALAVQQGKQVAIVDLTAGESGTCGTPALRAQEKSRATQLLGVSKRVQLRLPDSAVGSDSAHQQPIINILRQLRPHVVLAPFHEADRHPDHAAAGKLVREACFLAGVAKVGKGKPHRPAWLYHYMLHQPFTPSFVVDVSAVWAQKWAAILAYESQFGAGEAAEKTTAISQPHFLRFLEARAVYYGGLVGTAYGEAYYAAGPIGLDRLPMGNEGEENGRFAPAYKPYL
ncbi:MAG: bacillithiol biosynthesis deacetylase BshB1 [Chloroflexota bacterium]